MKIRTLFRAVRRFFRGTPCDRCGGPGAALVIDAVPAERKIDGRSGVSVKTYAVKSSGWLCPACRHPTTAA